jgi:hypothetical protein
VLVLKREFVTSVLAVYDELILAADSTRNDISASFDLDPSCACEDGYGPGEEDKGRPT